MQGPVYLQIWNLPITVIAIIIISDRLCDQQKAGVLGIPSKMNLVDIQGWWIQYWDEPLALPSKHWHCCINYIKDKEENLDKPKWKMRLGQKFHE